MSGLRTAGVLTIVGVVQFATALFVALFAGLTSPFLPLYLIAYTLGMRHALDADHITAIDNVSRSMLSRGESPTSVGLFFALGHSAVVSVTTLLVAVGTSRLQQSMGHFQSILSILSSALAAAVLLYLVPRNLRIASAILHADKISIDSSEPAPAGGLVSRILARFLTARLRAWHMLVIGALFGLGFETATALSVVALVMTQSSHGLRITTIAAFPALFTAGMVLVDALDGIVMERAYSWALKRPGRHRMYNYGITLASALLALFIGLFETATAIRQFVSIHGDMILNWMEAHMEGIGCAVIVGFASAYGVAALRSAIKISSLEVKKPN